MSFTFRPAVRENVNLLIGIAAATGAGKTYSAMRLAKGLCGDKPFAVIDTERRRALHYADFFSFDHCELDAPFSSEAYCSAIKDADTQGYAAIIIDSFSHEHEGEGGLLDFQEKELDEMVKRAMDRKDSRKEWEIREAMKRSAWIRPKAAHKRLMQTILHCNAHLIFCLRAQDKIDFIKDEKGKTKVVPMETLSGYKGWIPICDSRFPFELTASFIMMPDRPGQPVPIKLQEQHKPFFPLDKPITEEAGRQLAAWARGGTTSAAPNVGQGDEKTTVTGVSTPSPDTAVSKDQYDDMFAWLSESPDRMKAGRDLLKKLGYSNFKQVKESDLKAIYDCEKQLTKA
jgi:hypothetical protein